MSWALFWKGILALTLGGYAVLLLIVAVRGVFDIIDLLRDLHTR